MGTSLMQQLCKMNPWERLGYGGMHEIKTHPWFDGFDWQSLKRRTMPSPWKPELKHEEDRRYFDILSNHENDFKNWDDCFENHKPSGTPTERRKKKNRR